MPTLSRRYEFVLGCAAVALAASALRDELKSINISLGFATITGEDYFLGVVAVLLLCLWLFAIDYLLGFTRLRSTKIANQVPNAAYFFFAMAVASPLLLGMSFGLYQLTQVVSLKSAEIFATILSTVTGLLSGAAALIATKKYARRATLIVSRSHEVEQVKELEEAEHLLNDHYPAQAIIEAFKAMEQHLRKLLSLRGILTQPGNFRQLLDLSLRNELLKQEEVKAVDDIRKMRNSVAHEDAQFSEADARWVIDQIRGMIRNSPRIPS
jgi:hypothetical protein